MKPAGKGTWDSLYFDYPFFDAPDRTDLPSEVAVAIVGAGPVGMIAALTLARHGIRSTLIEAKQTFNDGSRAICVSRSSFNTLQSLGCVAPFLEKSLPWTSGRTFFRGQQILKFDMAVSAHEKYGPMYNIEQQYIEAYLHDAVAASDLIEMRWQTECTGLETDATGATLSLRDPAGDYRLRTDWLLAADGARSAIRRAMGLRLRGDNFEGRYVIADIRMKNPVPVERFALFDPDRRPGSTVLVHQQPDDIWRIDYQLRDGEDEAEALAEENIRAGVQQVLDECGFDAEWELEWWSIYSANTLLLDRYRHGRVVFIGDSAHIVPIFGVRGFNNGVLDGNNIGWKLAMVLKGEADEALLDSYDPERRNATLDVFDKAAKSAQFMTPRSAGYRVMRDAALSLALDHPFAGQFANPRNMTPYDYTDSPLTLPDQGDWSSGPPPGAAAPNVDMGEDFLLDRAGRGFSLLVFGTIPGLDLPEGVTLVPLDPAGPAAGIYGARDGSAVLIRPDLFLAARWHDATGAQVADALDTILAGGRP